MNINLASAQMLEELPGLGPTVAERIVALRDRRRFTRVDDLIRVKGFGPLRLRALRSHLTVDGASTLRVIAESDASGGTGTGTGSNSGAPSSLTALPSGTYPTPDGPRRAAGLEDKDDDFDRDRVRPKYRPRRGGRARSLGSSRPTPAIAKPSSPPRTRAAKVRARKR